MSAQNHDHERVVPGAVTVVRHGLPPTPAPLAELEECKYERDALLAIARATVKQQAANRTLWEWERARPHGISESSRFTEWQARWQELTRLTVAADRELQRSLDALSPPLRAKVWAE